MNKLFLLLPLVPIFINDNDWWFLLFGWF